MQKKIVKKSILVIFVSVLFIFFISNSTAFGAVLKDTSFIIKKMKAQPIQDKENSGYICFPPGQTIEVKLLGTTGKPTSYLVLGKAKQGSPTINWQGMAKYGPKVPIICYRYPNEITTVNLSTITLEQGYSMRNAI